MSDGMIPESVMDTLTQIIRSSKDYLQIIDQNDTKLVLKVRSVPTVQMQVEDEGTVISIDILEPDNVGSLVQQFRSVFMSSDE
ncbi:MAG: hypothetical protein LUP95_01905 [Euryarchaeota archaeon]|nr:hypothetical protein [Euryarchaeota archaeon]